MATETAIIDGKKVKKREQWDGKLDFVLSCLGYAVGLGSIWRFPYLCGRNGGAAFVIAYIILMLFAGLPTFYMEMVIGQYTSLTPHLLYSRMSPLFTGIGYCMVAISVYTAMYYQLIVTWSMFYLGASVPGIWTDLPWHFCNNTWNDEYCFDDKTDRYCDSTNTTYFKGTCWQNNSVLLGKNISADLRETASKQYNRHILNEGTGIDDIGWPKWDLTLTLFIAWVMIFLMMVKGVKWSGKVVYVTSTFPYIFLCILMVRGNLLDGSGDGVDFFIKPNWSRMLETGPWVDAAQQTFFSLSLGGGGLTTLASYNSFNNNLMYDTLIVVFGTLIFALMGGFTVFPMLGYIAKTIYPHWPAQQRVNKLAESGTTLVFVTYPDALDRMPAAWVWCILFFFMLFLLGIDTELVMVEVQVTAIVDTFPSLRKTRRKAIVVALTCFVGFLGGVLLCTPIGSYLVTLLDNYAGGLTLLIACFIEIIMISYIYGYKRLIENIKEMMGAPTSLFQRLIGYPINPFYWICWIFVTPVMLGATIVAMFVSTERTKQGDYVFPLWADLVGWGILISCNIWIPIVAIYRAVRVRNWRKLTRPTAKWGCRAHTIDAGENQLEVAAGDNNTMPFQQDIKLNEQRKGSANDLGEGSGRRVHPHQAVDRISMPPGPEASQNQSPFVVSGISPNDVENLRDYHMQHAYTGPMHNGERRDIIRRF
uniref:Transporter n=1 Tax=Plectus sambesii TaxID=2011161 RepID=A0A914WEB3_9BILA